MENHERLTSLCISWRKIIDVKSKQYKELDQPNPSAADCHRLVQLSVQLAKLREELAEMENELCDELYIPPYLYA